MIAHAIVAGLVAGLTASVVVCMGVIHILLRGEA